MSLDTFSFRKLSFMSWITYLPKTVIITSWQSDRKILNCVSGESFFTDQKIMHKWLHLNVFDTSRCVKCILIDCSVVRWNKVQCSLVQCNKVQCIIVQLSTVQCITILCKTVQYITVQTSPGHPAHLPRPPHPTVRDLEYYWVTVYFRYVPYFIYRTVIYSNVM